jgi:hypothetical protein
MLAHVLQGTTLDRGVSVTLLVEHSGGIFLAARGAALGPRGDQHGYGS